jgi:hypothetical protein
LKIYHLSTSFFLILIYPSRVKSLRSRLRALDEYVLKYQKGGGKMINLQRLYDRLAIAQASEEFANYNIYILGKVIVAENATEFFII